MTLDRLPMRERQHRLPRSAYLGETVVAVTACVEDKAPLFVEADTVDAFRGILAASAKGNLCAVPIYCFMPDHVHLILRGSSSRADAWKAVIIFKQRTGYWLRQHHFTVSWQKGFYDHILRREEAISAHIRYIANNPVRGGLVAAWEDYPYTGSIGADLADILNGLDAPHHPAGVDAG